MNEADQAGVSWRHYADQLHRHFEVTTQHRCLLWVDPAQTDPFEGQDIVERSRVRVPIRHPRFEPTLAPYLVPLDLTAREEHSLFMHSVELAWNSWSIEHLNAMLGQPVCGWVSSNSDARTTARHWGTRCHLHIFNREAKLCRFQDAGVREWLWPTLTDTQKHAMLGPASEIVAIGRSQHLIHQSRNDSSGVSRSPGTGELNDFPALQFPQAIWNRLDDYATVHAAWLTWRNSGDNNTATTQNAGWEHPVFQALMQARRLGLRDPIDRELFTLHGLQLGPDFYQDSKLDKIWRLTQAGEFYGSAIEEVTGCPADQLSAWIKR